MVGVLLLPLRHLRGQKSNKFRQKLVVLLAETGMGRWHDSGYAAGKTVIVTVCASAVATRAVVTMDALIIFAIGFSTTIVLLSIALPW